MPIKVDANGRIIEQTPSAAPTLKTSRRIRVTAEGKPIDYSGMPDAMNAQLKSDSPSRQRNLAIQHAMPFLGSLVGGALGGPFGSGIGAGLGTTYDRADSLVLGGEETKDAVKDIATETALGFTFDKLTGPLSKILSKGFSKAAGNVANTFGPPSLKIKPDVEAADAMGIPMKVSQATGSRIAQFLEDNFASKKSHLALEKKQQDIMTGAKDQLRMRHTGLPSAPDSPGEFFGAEGKDLIKENIPIERKFVDLAYSKTKFDANAAKIKITLPAPKAKQSAGFLGTATQAPAKEIEIVGPILYPKAGAFINKVKPEIDKIWNSYPEGSQMRAKYGEFKRMLDQLDKGLIPGDPSSKYVGEWETIKEFRTLVNKTVGSELDKDRAQGGLKKLADILGEEVDTSVKNLWEPKAPGASQRMKEATELSKGFHEMFPQRVLDRVGNTHVNPDASKLFDDAIKTPEATAEMIRALGPNKQRPIKGHFFEELMKSSNSPDKAIEMLENPQYKKVFTSPERAALTNLFRTDRTLASAAPGTRSLYLNYKAGSIGIAMAAGGINSLMGTGELRDSTLLGATALVGTKVFAQKVLMNPRFARSAARLARLEPSSNEAKFLRKTLLGAMKGERLIVRLKNGEDHHAHIGANGEPILDE